MSNQLGVDALASEESGMRASFDDLATFKH